MQPDWKRRRSVTRTNFLVICAPRYDQMIPNALVQLKSFQSARVLGF